jgi:excisionase family DNA binding protein
MNPTKNRLTDNQPLLSQAASDPLLDLYLTLPPDVRNARFAGTSCAAQLLGLSQQAIHSWINKGHVAAIRVGKKYQVDLASLRAYLLAKTML